MFGEGIRRCGRGEVDAHQVKEARKGPLAPLEEVFVFVVGSYCCGRAE